MDVEDKVMATLEKYIEGPIRRAGPNNVIMRCPFHDDNSPSFAMNIYNGLFICYACGEKGGFRSFLYKLGLTRDEVHHHYALTLQHMKENAPPPPDPDKPGVIVEDTNRHIPNDLLGVFHACPLSLLDEGFSEDVLLDFGVGVDERHNRITFPLRDVKGNLVGISGRAMLDDMEMRYKVYKEEYRAWDLPPYETDKSLLLWNAHRVLTNPGPLVIVEGFKACMWVHQAGITGVVALMTKYMSWAQRWLIQKHGGPYVLMLDNDEAGIKGTIDVSKSLAEVSPFVRIVDYDEEQPTDVPLQYIPLLIESSMDYRMLEHASNC